MTYGGRVARLPRRVPPPARRLVRRPDGLRARVAAVARHQAAACLGSQALLGAEHLALECLHAITLAPPRHTGNSSRRRKQRRGSWRRERLGGEEGVAELQQPREDSGDVVAARGDASRRLSVPKRGGSRERPKARDVELLSWPAAWCGVSPQPASSAASSFQPRRGHVLLTRSSRKRQSIAVAVRKQVTRQAGGRLATHPAETCSPADTQLEPAELPLGSPAAAAAAASRANQPTATPARELRRAQRAGLRPPQARSAARSSAGACVESR